MRNDIQFCKIRKPILMLHMFGTRKHSMSLLIQNIPRNKCVHQQANTITCDWQAADRWMDRWTDWQIDSQITGKWSVCPPAFVGATKKWHFVPLQRLCEMSDIMTITVTLECGCLVSMVFSESETKMQSNTAFLQHGINSLQTELLTNQSLHCMLFLYLLCTDQYRY